MSKKTSLGRQKIAIEKIHNKNRLQVTFSKRRTGLFKKASELCTLCGVEIAILVFSPTKKVFSFGHPDVNSIIDRFLGSDQTSTKSTALKMFESYSRNDSIRHLNMILAQLHGQLEEERDRGKNLDNLRKARQVQAQAQIQAQYWWESSIDELNVKQLHQLRISLEELKKNVKTQSAKLMAMDSANFVPPLPTADAINRVHPLAANAITFGNVDEFEHKHDLDLANYNFGNMSSHHQFINFAPESSFFGSL